MITLCPALNILHIYIKAVTAFYFIPFFFFSWILFFRFGFSLFSLVYFFVWVSFLCIWTVILVFAGGMCIVLVDAARIKCVPYILELSLCRIIHHSRHSTLKCLSFVCARGARNCLLERPWWSRQNTRVLLPFFIHSHSPAVVVVVVVVVLSLALSLTFGILFYMIFIFYLLMVESSTVP